RTSASPVRIFQNGVADDLYALGSILFLLLTAIVHDSTPPLTIKKLRRNVPSNLCQLVESLLATNADGKLTAEIACATLTSICLGSKRERRRLAAGKAA